MYSIYAILNALKGVLTYLCCAASTQDEESMIPPNLFEVKNEEELEKIRNKRLEKFENFKKKTITDQMNMEAQLAKTLGLDSMGSDETNEMISDDDEIDENERLVAL